MRVSVLIPAYNEEATIIPTLLRVRQQSVADLDFETIVIDDGSTDRTRALLAEHSELYAALVALPENRGKGAAVIEGLRHATGDYVLVQDADLEYDPSEYAKLLQPVIRFGADLVLGSRLTAPPFTRVHYFWHRLGNQTITALFNILNNTTFTDIYSGYVVIRRSLVDPNELRALGWDQQAEILSRVAGRSRVIYEVPISYHGRTYDEGKKIRASATLSVIWRIVLEATVHRGKRRRLKGGDQMPEDPPLSWPEERSPIVTLETPHVDSRGLIQPLVDREMHSALLITARAGSLRGNHYHKTDWHYCYVTSGKMKYFYRPLGSDDPPSCVTVAAGEMFFTPPLIEHAMVFEEETVFITLGRNARDQASYEADVVRVPVVPPQ